MRKLGADDISFDTIVATGANTSKPHAVPTAQVLQKDTYTLCDFGAVFAHYHSDMTRTFAIGEPSSQLQEIYHIVRTAKQMGLKAVKAGVLASDIDKICRDYITSAGYGEYFNHATGHGVGLDIHEYPRISAGCDVVLEENMIITVEPGIYLPGVGGVRDEDMVQVLPDGYRNFSMKD
jgi:Xaa-Pro aminopeptidase